MSISEEMKLKAGIVTPVVSGPSVVKKLPTDEKNLIKQIQKQWVRLSYSSQKEKTLEIFRLLLVHGFPKSQDLTHTGHN